jgi:hypothetical protein
MDKSQRSVEEYLSAARREPGISEREIRALVDHAWDQPSGAAARGWWRRLLPWSAALLVLGGGAIALMTPGGSDRTGPAPIAAAIRRPAPVASAIPAPLPMVPRSVAAPPAEAPSIVRTEPTLPVARRQPVVRLRPLKTEQQRTTNTISREDNDMNITSIKRFAGTAFVAASVVGAAHIIPPAAAAQHSRAHIEQNPSSPVMQRFEQEMGMVTYDYWIAHLNQYKRTIDRTLSAEDLAALNRLRVRFAVMIGDAKIGAMVNSNTNDDKNQVATIDMDMGDAEGLQRLQDFLTIYQEAKELASKYQTQFKPLGEAVVQDFFGFIDQMSTRVDRFASENQSELAKSEDGKGLLTARADAKKFVDELNTDQGKMMIQMGYSMAAEPLIMLYDGSELSLFLQQAAPFAKGVTGLNLPDASVLHQSTPNPASGSVTIGYQLREPSESTLLRIFNSNGTLVGTFDQGSRPAGENNAVVDVSSYPAGRYLYHLTIQTSKGEQVYSKSMRVVR